MRTLILIAMLILALFGAVGAAGAPTLQIVSNDYRYDMIPNQVALSNMSGHVVVKNESRRALTSLTLTVHLQDGYDNDLVLLKQSVGTLEPDQTYTWSWSWYNYYSLFIQPVAEVTCDVGGKQVRVVEAAPSPAAPGPAVKAAVESWESVTTVPFLTVERWQAPESPGSPAGYREAVPASAPPGY